MMRNVTGFLRGRILLLTATVFVVILGNMRPTALQAAIRNHAAASVPGGHIAGGLSTDSSTNVILVADPFVFGNTSDDKMPDQVESSPSAADDGELVPAIYAWDPDVRFVYYRHISKWM